MNGDMKLMEGMDMNNVMYPEITGYEDGESNDKKMKCRECRCTVTKRKKLCQM